MAIEEYNFGKIKIEGKIYDHDVEVDWQGKVLKWWRKESHLVDFEDLKRALEKEPKIIVIGTGAYGVAKVTQKAQEKILEKEIKLIVDQTSQAVKTFNFLLEKKEKVIGLFHLTC